jgi:hypothetical protein
MKTFRKQNKAMIHIDKCFIGQVFLFTHKNLQIDVNTAIMINVNITVY